jgi:DNA-binding SARP family transcriptional activator
METAMIPAGNGWPELPGAGAGDRPAYRFLGALECGPGHRPTQVRGRFQRALLGALLAADSRPVSAGALIGELWDEQPPDKAENALQAHVSRLRRTLAEGGMPQLPQLVPGGYQLAVARDDVDAGCFVTRLARARELGATDPGAAVAVLREALALWRGPVFGGPLGGAICGATAARFEAARIAALEFLFDLELAWGRHAEVLPELTELDGTAGLNERFCELLMVALYRCGRQSEALAAYRRMRARLDLELGVEPSPTLRAHEHAVLSHHPALAASADHTVLRRGAGEVRRARAA